MSFESTIKKIRQERPQVYKTFTLDLSTARSEYELPIAGNYLVVIAATDLNANIQLRFNEVSADALILKKRQGWKLPFYRLYITNTAQAGLSVTLAYGISETPLERIDQGSVVDIQSITDPVDISDRNSRRLGQVVKMGIARGFNSVGAVVAPAVGNIEADTGPLAAGTYYFKLIFGLSGNASPGSYNLQHRDAANAANITVFPMAGALGITSYDFNLDIALNERLRVYVASATGLTVHFGIFYEQLA